MFDQHSSTFEQTGKLPQNKFLPWTDTTAGVCNQITALTSSSPQTSTATSIPTVSSPPHPWPLRRTAGRRAIIGPPARLSSPPATALHHPTNRLLGAEPGAPPPPYLAPPPPMAAALRPEVRPPNRRRLWRGRRGMSATRGAGIDAAPGGYCRTNGGGGGGWSDRLSTRPNGSAAGENHGSGYHQLGQRSSQTQAVSDYTENSSSSAPGFDIAEEAENVFRCYIIPLLNIN